MVIKLYNCSAEMKKVDKTGFLSNEIELTGALRNATDLLNPVIVIESATVITSNYAYLPDFNRYYFIGGITCNTKDFYTLSLKVDVLMTYKDQIKELKAIVARNENESNIAIYDNMLPTTPINKTEIYKATNTFFDVNLSNIADYNIILTAYQ